MKLVVILGIMVLATIVGSVGSVLLKKGSVKLRFSFKAVLRNYELIGGVALYVLTSLVFIWLLKYAELSFLYPLTGLTYVWVSFLSIKYLKEHMNSLKWIGIVLILLGAVFVAL